MFSMDSLDPIYAAQVPGWPLVYVVGSFDSRITFYSQQVRGFSLAHSFLNTEGRGKDRFAIIGAGAAGLSIAAGLSLLHPKSQIDVFEREARALHLQRGCTKRNLHPHIYDWPQKSSTAPAAGLPFLEWTAGTASSVAEAVIQQFETLQAHRQRRLLLRPLRDVTSVERVGLSAYRVFHQHAEGGDPDSAAYDAVFITIGFGAERGLLNTHLNSYWSDAGVPGPLRYAQDELSVIISGSGDGGLIDLCAAALEDFDHTELIKLVSNWPGIDAAEEELIEIDRESEEVGADFNFVEAYDRNIGTKFRRDGLIREITLRLRPRVRIIFNTKSARFLQQPTSALNRLLVYLLFAATADAGRPVTHVSGSIAADPSQHGSYLINGEKFRADELYVRHGAAKKEAFEPFALIRAAYQENHERWLALDKKRRAPPKLDTVVSRAIETALVTSRIPVQRALHEEALALLPLRVKFALNVDGTFGWFGDLKPVDLLEWWDSPTRSLNVECALAPSARPALSTAIARFIIHARQLHVETNDVGWNDWLSTLTRKSAHATALERPVTGPILPANLISCPMDSNLLAAELHTKMDSWMLDRVDAHLSSFLTTGDETDNWIIWEINAELRGEMALRWLNWAIRLRADSHLLSRVFRLAACTVEDDAGDSADRQVLVGRLRLPNIVRSITLALAAAGAWPVSTPRGTSPGNFDRRSIEGAEIATIHASGADLINGRTLATMASAHAWRTSIVLLSELTAPISLEESASLSLIDVGDSELRIDVLPPSANIIVGADAELQLALRSGRDAVAAHFAAAETRIHKQWTNLLDRGIS
jgi:hypothetical protein